MMNPTQGSVSCDYTLRWKYVWWHFGFSIFSRLSSQSQSALKGVLENHNSCIYSIYYLLVFKPLVASISFCVKRMIANMLPTFLCDSESNVAWAHPSLTYLMAGLWWRPVAQIEKFPVAKWNVWLSLQSRKIGDCSILIPNSISDKVDFWPIYCALLVDISAARTYRMNEWILMNTKDVHRLFFQVIVAV